MHFKYTALVVTMAVMGVSAIVPPQDYIGKSVSAPSAKGSKSAQDMVFNQFISTPDEQEDTDNTDDTAPSVEKKLMEIDEDEDEMDENELDENENEPDEKSSNQKDAQDRVPPSNNNKNDEIAVQSTKVKDFEPSSVVATPSSTAAAPPPPSAAVVKSATPVAAGPFPSPSSSSSSSPSSAPIAAAPAPASNGGVSSISLENLSFPAGPTTGAAAATSASGGKPAAATATGRGANRGLAAGRRKNTAVSTYSVPTRFSVVPFVLVAVALF